MDYKMINTLTKKDYKELTLEEFEAMIHNDELEAGSMEKSGYVDNKEIYRAANDYNNHQLYSLFDNLCDDAERIVTITEYVNAYLNIVKEDTSDWDESEEDMNSFYGVLKNRAMLAYKSNLAEIHFELMSKQLFGENYEVVADRRTDRILGSDVVVLSELDDSAYYIHITSNSNTAYKRVMSKGNKVVTVEGESIPYNYVWGGNIRNFERDFTDHIVATYSYTESSSNYVVNGCYLFKEEYVKRLFRKNVGKCTRKYYDRLKDYEVSNKQVRENAWGGTTSWYES